MPTLSTKQASAPLHTLRLVNLLAISFYGERKKVLEELRCAQCHRNLGSGRAETLSLIWLNSKPVLFLVPAPNCLRSRRDLLKSQVGVLDLKWDDSEKLDINSD